MPGEDLSNIFQKLEFNLVASREAQAAVIRAQKKGETTVDLSGGTDDEEGTVYDLEMQTTKKKDLPKRTRYYQGLIDLELLNRGASFSELNDSYII